MASVLTITQLNTYVGQKLKDDKKLKGIAVRGEISNFSIHGKTGHMYFSLKDDGAQIRAVMFKFNATKLKFKPKDGMEVMAVGNIEIFERDGQYQIKVTELVTVGEGAVSSKTELIKKKLGEKGIFSDKLKKSIPRIPKKIAIVTSADAAALQDILKITSRRYALCDIEVYTAFVQGEKAPKSIASALAKADKSGADTIILTRGGGSSEDLSAFNTEDVAMAIYYCDTPVVSAVGHETDTTIADYAADIRVPTPSAAAEICTPDKAEITASFELIDKRLASAFELYLSKKERAFNETVSALRLSSPYRKLDTMSEKLTALENKLRFSMNTKLMKSESEFEKSLSRLQALSPFGVLDRGYSIASVNGKVIAKDCDVKTGDTVDIRTKSLKISAEVREVEPIAAEENE